MFQWMSYLDQYKLVDLYRIILCIYSKLACSPKPFQVLTWTHLLREGKSLAGTYKDLANSSKSKGIKNESL